MRRDVCILGEVDVCHCCVYVKGIQDTAREESITLEQLQMPAVTIPKSLWNAAGA